jgi:hypothetical protein
VSDKPMIVSVSSLLPPEYQDMKATAVKLLDLLDDIHQSEQAIIPDDIYQRITDALNDSTWVDA